MLELTLPCVGLASHLQGEVIHQDASCYGTAAIKSGNSCDKIRQRRAMWPECVFTFARGSCYRALARVLENVWYSDSLTKS